MIEVARCLVPDCGSGVHTRGLCEACYKLAIRLIRDGQTTWVELESLGRSLPPERRDTTLARDWFLRGVRASASTRRLSERIREQMIELDIEDIQPIRELLSTLEVQGL